MSLRRIIGIKRYLRSCAGPSPDFWEQIWERSPTKFDELVALADARLVRKCAYYLPQKARLLEGGCGCGAYLASFHKLGHEVVGIDFAERTVARLNESFPFLDVRVGDIRSLPFPNESFDAYFSGGVIEHFEDGLMPQVEEAFRVLKPGGLFLVTVPYLNILRRLSAYLYGDREKIDLDGRNTYLEAVVDASPGCNSPYKLPEAYVFHEYIFAPAYMRKVLARAGFTVEAEMPFSSRWGLLDIEPMRKLAGIGKAERHLGHKIAATPLRIIDVIEKSRWPAIVYLADFIGIICGNLRLYIGRKPT